AERKPLVLINRLVDGVDSVLPELRPGVEQAVRHLHELGHSRIAYLGGPTTSWIGRMRGDAIAAAAADAGVNCVELAGHTPTQEGGRAALDSIAETGATAVIAYNGLMAIGLMRDITERGAAVPAALSVVGFD